MIKPLASLCAGLLFASCASNTPPEPAQPSARISYTSVSTTDASFAPMTGAKFAWYSPVITWAASGPTENYGAIENIARSTIEKALVARGFIVTHSQLDADYVIGMVIASSDMQEATEFAQYFGLSSGLSTTDGTTAQAMIGVIPQSSTAITPPSPNALLWKANLGTQILGEGYSREIRLARAKVLFEQLISSMPAGK